MTEILCTGSLVEGLVADLVEFLVVYVLGYLQTHKKAIGVVCLFEDDKNSCCPQRFPDSARVVPSSR